MALEQFKISFDPLADPAAVVQTATVRFTMLTGRLIRMQYSPSGEFEDRPSQAFWYRRQPRPEFSVRQAAEGIEIDTAFLHLTYQITEAGFTPSTLSVLVKATGATWVYGDPASRGGNLFGTARTLDQASGKVRLEPGLVGRAGWAVVDDSASLVFNDGGEQLPDGEILPGGELLPDGEVLPDGSILPYGWLEPRKNPGDIDLYFFGYGHDYVAALQEFSLVAGDVPLIPRWALGNWWSRYWAYSQDELLALVQEFRDHQVPLAVCIVDMDWHLTQTGNRASGWTGYTWNRKLFPNPEGLILQLHAMGLRVALNLHPAEGIYPHEIQYRSFAEFLGLDPDLNDAIPFDSADPRFIQAYFEILHHPIEAQGADFWWLDWQQGTRARLPGLDPLWWLNHLHFYDLGRDGEKRPFIFSRWGGLGNHRYPIGFSGDTVVGWEALANQPSFTATAANVGYGWWSHDIGGHMGGIEDDELYTRWVQYGVFSPILRLHSTNNPYHERRPWGRGPAAAQVAALAMRLRHTLIPYIYSMAWRHHTTSLPLVLPMYYSHPEKEEAYQASQQYWFGSELIAAPFTSPAHPETRLARQTIWLPVGEWFNFFSGERLEGGRWVRLYGELADIPVFVRAGGIIPLAPELGWAGREITPERETIPGREGTPGVENPAELRLLIFPGADNRFELVEDDGVSTSYTRGAYAVTVFSQTWQDDEFRFSITPARGDLSVLPQHRTVTLFLRGFSSAVQAAAQLNGKELPLRSVYDLDTDTLRFDPFELNPTDEFVLLSRSEGGMMSERERTIEHLRKYLHAFRLDSRTKQAIDNGWADIVAGQISLRSFNMLSDAQLAVLEQLLEA